MVISRHRPQAVVALVVAFAIAAFFGLATVSATSSEAATIYACKKKKNGDLRIVKKSKRCKRGEVKTKWNSKGPNGTAGPQGAAGPPGPAGAVGAPASTYLPVQIVNRFEVPTTVCTPYDGDVAELGDNTCSSAVSAPTTKVIYQSPYAIIKGSCYGIAGSGQQTTAQITVETAMPTQSELYVSFFALGLGATTIAKPLTASTRPYRVDNRNATASGSDAIWGNFTQLTVIDSRNVEAIQSFTATIVPYASGPGQCRFIGHVTASP